MGKTILLGGCWLVTATGQPLLVVLHPCLASLCAPPALSQHKLSRVQAVTPESPLEMPLLEQKQQLTA